MRSDPGQRSVIPALTGLRIVAALAVVAFHLREEPLAGLLPGLAQQLDFAVYGGLGVDLFFTLSGFILSLNYLDAFARLRRRALVRFLCMRLARIYPVHVVTLLAMVVIVAVTPEVATTASGGEVYSAEAFVANVFLVQAWGTSDFTWNYPAWSISAEWFAYLVFPFLAFVMCRWGLARATWAYAGLVVTVVGGIAALATSAGSGFEPLIRVATEFSTGCLLYVLHRETPLGQGLAAGARLAVILAASIVLTVALDGNLYTLAPALALVIWGIARTRGPLARLLSSRSMVFGGEASYALYMTHVVVITALSHLLPTADYTHEQLFIRIAVTGVYVASIAVVALLTYKYVERPARRWIRRQLSSD
ncbi:acyltransferase [Saccharopolyspora taberi]|uniref:acyltransferase family protein n=1 Tax=Saccharopolyspora taberi TaxID=60895 RepID=UPI0031E419DE